MVKIKEKVGSIVRQENLAVDRKAKKEKVILHVDQLWLNAHPQKKEKGTGRISWKGKSSGGEMRKQNRIKMKNGGFIAKGCGKVMNNRRKVTTIS